MNIGISNIANVLNNSSRDTHPFPRLAQTIKPPNGKAMNDAESPSPIVLKATPRSLAVAFAKK
jgi:hypothetical protein